MSIYVELLKRIVAAYQDASNGFHTADAAKKISEALTGFEEPFNRLGAAIDKLVSHRGQDIGRDLLESRNAQRVLDAQYVVLQSAIASAARSDEQKIARVRIDQLSQLAQARVQQNADATLSVEVEKLIQQAHADAAAAASQYPPIPPPPVDPGGIDPDALAASLALRAAPKEDRLFARQLGLIGGQRSPGGPTAQ